MFNLLKKCYGNDICRKNDKADYCRPLRADWNNKQETYQDEVDPGVVRACIPARKVNHQNNWQRTRQVHGHRKRERLAFPEPAPCQGQNKHIQNDYAQPNDGERCEEAWEREIVKNDKRYEQQARDNSRIPRVAGRLFALFVFELNP